MTIVDTHRPTPLGGRVVAAFIILLGLVLSMVALVTWVAVVVLEGGALEARLLVWAVGVLVGQWLLAVTASPLLGAWSCKGVTAS